MRIQGLAAAAAVMMLSVPAIAQKAFTREKVSISGRGEYGFNLQAGSLNPYGLGFGARAGYTLKYGLYVGGSFDLFLGSSTTMASRKLDASHFQVMGEAGYDLAILTSKLVVRPLGTLGLAQHGVDFCFEENGSCGGRSRGGMVLGFGANVMYDFGGFMLGGDTRFNWLVGSADENTSIILGVLAGASF